MELEYTWADCERLYESRRYRLEQERDMTRNIMAWSYGNAMSTRPKSIREIMPLQYIDNQSCSTQEVTKEEIDEKYNIAKKLLEERIKK